MIKKLEKWFDIYNNKLFNNELPKIKIKKSRGKKVLGYYRYIAGPYKAGTIYITSAYKFNDIKYKEILIHEMIHAYIHYKNIYDNNSHGKEFISIMNEVNEKLQEENIKITIKTEDINNYEIKNKVSYPFILFKALDNLSFIVRVAKSRKSEYASKYSCLDGYRLFYSDNDYLNGLKKSISKANVYQVEEGNDIYKELIKEGILKKENIEYKSEKEKKITIYAVHIAKRIFKVNIPEELIKDVIFNITDETQEKCLDIISKSYYLKTDLPISVNDILDSIILLAKGAYSDAHGQLNGFDDKYINI